MKVNTPKGLIFDFSYLMGKTKIKESDLERFKEVIFRAGKEMESLRTTKTFAGHLSKDGSPEPVRFTQLVSQDSDRVDQIKEYAKSCRGQYHTMVSFGIGGSFLGNKVLFDLFKSPYWNQQNDIKREGYPRCYFSGNNLDPLAMGSLISEILRQKADYDLEGIEFRLLGVVISKSGSTVDTMASFFVFKEAIEKAGVSFDICAVTDPSEGEAATWLGKLAAEEKWTRFDVPDGIGGRFSVLGESSLLTAALVGIDIDQLLSGAFEVETKCLSADWRENPALLNAALKWIGATQYNQWNEIFMVYGDFLKSLSEWYVQLMAESLGKKHTLTGEVIEYGRTPIVAVGTTDMHAQTQAHQEGRRDKIVQFISIEKWSEDYFIPDLYPQISLFHGWAGVSLGEALELARQSNEEALDSDGRWSANFVLPELSPYHVGGLLYYLMLSVVYEGFLAGVDPFDQPGVEAYKKIMFSKFEEAKEKANKG